MRGKPSFADQACSGPPWTEGGTDEATPRELPRASEKGRTSQPPTWHPPALVPGAQGVPNNNGKINGGCSHQLSTFGSFDDVDAHSRTQRPTCISRL